MLRRCTSILQTYKHYADLRELQHLRYSPYVMDSKNYSPYVMDSNSLMQTGTVRAASQEINLISRWSVSKELMRILKLA